MTVHLLDVVDGICLNSSHEPDHHDPAGCNQPPSEWKGHQLTCQKLDPRYPPCDYGNIYDTEGTCGIPECHYEPCRALDRYPCCENGHPIIEHRVLIPYTGPGAEPRDAVWRTVRVSIQAIPIVDEVPTGYTWVIVRNERGEWLSWRYGYGETPVVTLPADARPGQYAILGTEVKES